VLAVRPPNEVSRLSGSMWILTIPTSGGFLIMDGKSSFLFNLWELQGGSGCMGGREFLPCGGPISVYREFSAALIAPSLLLCLKPTEERGGGSSSFFSLRPVNL